MDSIDRLASITEKVLCDLAAAYPSKGEVRTLRLFDRHNGQFLLIDEGWNGYRRIHAVWAHVEVRLDKLWIHEDGTEEGIANLLVAAGAPKDSIVLAFQSPSLRDVSEFAVA